MKTVITILDSKPVEREWLGWLERAFRDTQTHDALLYLLLNGIQDKRFVDKSIGYGLDLITTAVQSRAVLDASVNLVQECLVREPRVVKEAVELCKWFVT